MFLSFYFSPVCCICHGITPMMVLTMLSTYVCILAEDNFSVYKISVELSHHCFLLSIDYLLYVSNSLPVMHISIYYLFWDLHLYYLKYVLWWTKSPNINIVQFINLSSIINDTLFIILLSSSLCFTLFWSTS